VTGPLDTQNFEDFDEEKGDDLAANRKKEKEGGNGTDKTASKDLDFVGYTYKNFEVVGDGEVRKKAGRSRPSMSSIFPGTDSSPKAGAVLASLAGMSLGDDAGTPEFHTAPREFHRGV
jgi:hypothetical protein|tara:strand:+ start:1707 stop:2060 length:354 start_codon:yes stop_codon:yes gene_type:complete